MIHIHPEDAKKDFLNKLQALLEEYKANIYFTVSPYSDTHGLHDEKMVISSSLFSSSKFKEDIWYEQNGWSIDNYDLRS